MRRRTYLGGVAGALFAGCLGTTRGSTAPRCPQFDDAARGLRERLGRDPLARSQAGRIDDGTR